MLEEAHEPRLETDPSASGRETQLVGGPPCTSARSEAGTGCLLHKRATTTAQRCSPKVIALPKRSTAGTHVPLFLPVPEHEAPGLQGTQSPSVDVALPALPLPSARHAHHSHM